jgi:triosephosphate isomerase
MSRTPIIAGNWKMNTDAAAARQLMEAIKAAGTSEVQGVEKVLCPPFLYLPLVAELARGTTLQLGGQDLHWEEKGAFTGEVSAPMLKDYATHVIIGHSERRQYFCETDESVNSKLRAALAHGLIPIVCVGETGEQRNRGEMREVLKRQVVEGLAEIDFPATAIIAYEPVWAIGTGVAATAQDANEAIVFIRALLESLHGEEIAHAVRILYGGSVTPANVVELVSQPEVDGGLVGGASLVAESYAAMVKAIGQS